MIYQKKDNTKRAVIISSKLLKNNNNNRDCHVVMKFESEDNWDENYLQLMAFLRKIYNFNNDEVEYDEHPFKIYQIEPNNLDEMVKKAATGNVSKFDTFIEEYGIDVEIDTCDSLEEYCHANEDCNECGMYVAYKKYFLFEYNEINVYHWAPSKYCIMDWDSEFSSMKECICKHFNLMNNDKLELYGEDDTLIVDGDTCETAWEELIDGGDDEKMYKFVVTGQVRCI